MNGQKHGKKVVVNYKSHPWYHRLSKKIESYIPKEYDPMVGVVPSVKEGKDMIVISLLVPKGFVKKLMWSLKVWRAK